MITPCAAPGCEEPASQRCSACKSVRYCSRECQRRHWTMEHREACVGMAAARLYPSGVPPLNLEWRSSIGIVAICDAQVKPSTILADEMPTIAGGNGWEPCPVPNMLGVPIVMKKTSPCQCEICAGYQPSATMWPQPTMQVEYTSRQDHKATHLAIEPHTGLAPMRWMGSHDNHLGIVAVARTDYNDFGVQDWAILEDYISGPVMDSWGIDPPERDARLTAVCNARAYTNYLVRRRGEDTLF